MSLFAVIALKEGAFQVDEAVGKLPAATCYKIEQGKWIVDSELSTARQLSESLGLRTSSPHVVFSVRGYSGRAQPDLWEWMVAQSEKKDG